MSTKSSGGLGSDSYIDWQCKILNKKYIMIKKLGYGSYASVWMGFDILDKKFYAVKIHNSEDYNAGKEETNIIKKLNTSKCKHIINLIDSFIHTENDADHYCLVMELMACSLEDIIRDKKYQNGLPYDFIK